ncbi:MAG: hypothetical protein QMD66_05760 [Actinomycetota bacterium]|nr:hypothetical protein [Actinomycetota bacterium]
MTTKLRRNCLFFIPVFLVIGLFSLFCPVRTEARESRKVILIVIDGVGIEDLSHRDLIHLHGLIEKGAMGLMNTRTASRISPTNNYLSIGAGAKAEGGALGGLAFNSSEVYETNPTGEIFWQRTGIKPPPDGVVTLTIAKISRQNARLPWNIFPGSLGTALKEAKLKAGVLGNADVDQEFHREISLISMDQLGRTPFGDVGRNILRKNPMSPGGWQTDYDVLLSKSLHLLRKVDFLAIETGDTSRVNACSPLLMDWKVSSERKSALKRADEFIGRLISRIDLGKTLIIVVTPTPPIEMIKEGNSLTPIIVAGGGIKPGVLTSETTRSHGIVSNIDITPTILSYLEAKISSEMLGCPLQSEPQDQPISYLLSLNERIFNRSKIRVPALKMYVTTIALVLIISTILLLMGTTRKRLRALQFLLLWLICVPVTLLFLPFSIYSSLALTMILAFLGSAVVVLISLLPCLPTGRSGRRALSPIIFITLLTSGVLLLDVLTGSHLMQRSIIGYCPIIGARFYGIGNECMGILIGSSIAGITALLEIPNFTRKSHVKLAGLTFLCLVVIFGHPALGTNVGGAIAAVVGYLTTYFGLLKRKISLKLILFIALAVIIALAFLIFLDLFGISPPSHLGKAITLIRKGGLSEGLKIIQRKFAMNVKGTRYTFWTRVLIAVLVIFPILIIRPAGILKKIKGDYPCLTSGLMGIAVASIVAFIFNDTGAAAAATTCIFAVVTLLYIIIEEQRT